MIHRAHRNPNYMTFSAYHLRDKSLSWQAMGMLTFMLSCKDGFKFSIEGLTQCAANGNTATRSALKELRDKGYVEVTPLKENGRIVEWIYDFYETPKRMAYTENPDAEIPDVENQHVENDGQSNNQLKDNISPNGDNVRENNNPSIKENNNYSSITPYNPPSVIEKICFEQFEAFRLAYKGTKRGAKTEFENFKKKYKAKDEYIEIAQHLLADYNAQELIKDANRKLGVFVPQPKNLQTYINQRCWEEQIQLASNSQISYGDTRRSNEQPSQQRQRDYSCTRFGGSQKD